MQETIKLQDLIHFAEINNMMNWSFNDVINEYLTTRDLASDYEKYYEDDRINLLTYEQEIKFSLLGHKYY